VADTLIVHPNRDKPVAKATKAIVTLLLLVSAGLVLVVTAGGWPNLQGAQIVSVLYVIVYLALAYYIARWNRGSLPVAAGLAVLLLVVAAIAGPAWFDRDKNGYDNPGLPPGLLGLLTLIIVPVQFLLIVFAMRGFSQEWNVEVEVSRDEFERRGGPGNFEAQPQT
jgi:energy-coupling factor transporter transmembrane protein EcfT